MSRSQCAVCNQRHSWNLGPQSVELVSYLLVIISSPNYSKSHWRDVGVIDSAALNLIRNYRRINELLYFPRDSQVM